MFWATLPKTLRQRSTLLRSLVVIQLKQQIKEGPNEGNSLQTLNLNGKMHPLFSH